MASNPKSILRRVMPTAHRVLIERFIKREFIGIEGRVLVIGAGHDPYRDLLPNAESVVVTDISSESGMIDEVADAHDLQYENESFDVVIAIEVFEHLHSPLCAIRECRRVLAKGGIFICSVPFMFHVHGDPSDYQRLTRNGLSVLTNEFEVVEIHEIGGRLATVSDILTTACKAAVPLRLLNHIFRIPLIGEIKSRDCPSGYWLKGLR